MAETDSPSILAFDVNETLLDITTLEPLFERLFGDAGTMREWFAQLILYSEAVTLCGRYVPFGALGAGALKMLGDTRSTTVSDDDVAELRERLAAMPAHPDAAAALRRLAEAGFRLVTVTNSAPGGAPSPLERAGLAEHFERSFTVHEVGRFKPAPEVYRMVWQALGVGPSDICLVAAHAWDTLGAQAAGCRGALVTLPGNAVLPVEGLPTPDIVGDSLSAVAEAIITRWR